MKNSQSGFTLIELVVVIVLLGILGVTALGKFQDLSGDAASAAVKGVASELGASSAINYAEGIIDGDYTVPLNVANICDDAILGLLFQSGSWPDTNFTVTGTGNCTGTAGAGDTASCTITRSTQTATATLICTD